MKNYNYHRQIKIQKIVKIPRINKEKLRGGSGYKVFEGSLFYVFCGTYGGVEVTEIMFKTVDLPSIYLKGHHKLKTDKKVIEQLEYKEIKKMFEMYYKKGVEQGKREKSREVLNALNVPNYLF